MPRARQVTMEDGTVIMMKICSRCKEDMTTDCFSPNNARIDKVQSHCKSCKNTIKNERNSIIRQTNDWEAHAKSCYYRASSTASNKGIAICSRDEWMVIFWEQFAATNGCCPEMGFEYRLDTVRGEGKNNPRAPSPDQISPSAGYVRGNIRWVSGFFNNLKNDHTLGEVELMMESYMYRRGVIEEGEIPQPERPIYYPPAV